MRLFTPPENKIILKEEEERVKKIAQAIREEEARATAQFNEFNEKIKKEQQETLSNHEAFKLNLENELKSLNEEILSKKNEMEQTESALKVRESEVGKRERDSGILEEFLKKRSKEVRLAEIEPIEQRLTKLELKEKLIENKREQIKKEKDELRQIVWGQK